MKIVLLHNKENPQQLSREIREFSIGKKKKKRNPWRNPCKLLWVFNNIYILKLIAIDFWSNRIKTNKYFFKKQKKKKSFKKENLNERIEITTTKRRRKERKINVNRIRFKRKRKQIQQKFYKKTNSASILLESNSANILQ